MSQEPLRGVAYLATTSKQVDVELHVSGGYVTLKGVSGKPITLCSIEDLIVDAPIGRLPRRVHFPDGTLMETEDFGGVRALTGETVGGVLNRSEAFRPRLIVFVAAALGGAFLVWRFALPLLVWLAVLATPEAVRDTMDRSTLATLDRFIAEPSKLSPDRQAEINGIFQELVVLLPDDSHRDFTLEFRDLPGLGPNAAAMPGGKIIMTDALVNGYSNHTIAGVLGHELGHVVEDHGLQQLYRSLGIYILVALIAGETGPILDELLLEGNLLLSLRYSRRHENEADAFGVRLSHEAGYDPRGLIEFFRSLPQVKSDEIDWLSTHPASQERIERMEALVEEL